jgi:hypothetical protein
MLTQQTFQHLRALKLTAMADAFPQQLEQPNTQQLFLMSYRRCASAPADYSTNSGSLVATAPTASSGTNWPGSTF